MRQVRLAQELRGLEGGLSHAALSDSGALAKRDTPEIASENLGKIAVRVHGAGLFREFSHAFGKGVAPALWQT